MVSDTQTTRVVKQQTKLGGGTLEYPKISRYPDIPINSIIPKHPRLTIPKLQGGVPVLQLG